VEEEEEEEEEEEGEEDEEDEEGEEEGQRDDVPVLVPVPAARGAMMRRLPPGNTR
jgi:hypothetical protein